MPQQQDLLESNAGFDSESDSGSDSDDPDEELVRVRTAIAPAPVDATPQELRQALEVTQKLLLNLHGRYQETMKRNTLLEAATSKGRKRRNLTPNDLAMAAKEDTIRVLGRKYSITHCLWINLEIFPLRTCPDIDLNSKERWISGVLMEDGVKAKLFQFIPAEERELMNYQSFGSQFGRGVSNARSEMASDVKACAGAIFGLNTNIFIRGYKRHEDSECRALLLSPHGDYTKFALVLFPTPKKPVPNEMLKSAKLVQVLKVSLFGKSSLAATGAASSRMKAKIWKLRATTPGMIAAAAVVAIFLLSGDAELTEIGETTKIPYREYHNFFRQCLLTGGPWARQVFLFFNDALFSTSSSVPPSTHDDGPGHMYEEEFEHAMEQELEGPVFNPDHLDPSLRNSPLSDSEDEARPPAPPNHPPAPPHHPPAPLNHPPTPLTVNATAAPTIVARPVPAPSESISSAMGDLDLGHQDARVGAEHLGPVEADTARPKPKPKPRRKAKTADNLVVGEGFPVDSTSSAVGSNIAQTTRRSGRKAI
ncbi:hypothetical protein DEU56DRAFT_914593 [Suillus clintonianus]|uniref:uncharacterized protein n=1 Tax=Suillus clintonianus TaxID=1904413 RepID=UPI001B85FAF9|nr:uncharacterized protein DEU56DRAFT_914593 [Suillus clintonianus]KAG2131055.1 hypothetical protein DEU56DRAFT_914593 [Suillus clintonianus]